MTRPNPNGPAIIIPRQRRDDDDGDGRTERWLALLCGFVGGLLMGGALGYTVGAGWWM